MFESLEPRKMFSAATHAASVALRSDIAALSAPIAAITRTYSAEIRAAGRELAIYDSPATDDPMVASIKTAFITDMNVLNRDIKFGKLLLNRDIAHLVTDSTGASKHLGRVVGDETLLNEQATAVVSTLLADSDLLVQDFANAVTPLSEAHLIDATLGAQLSTIYGTIDASTVTIENTTNKIQTTDVPDFIAAVDPSNAE